MLLYGSLLFVFFVSCRPDYPIFQNCTKNMTSERSYDSPLGRLTLTDNGRALTGIYFDTQKRAVGSGMSGAIWEPDTASCKNRDEINGLSVFAMTCRWLDIYFDGRIPDFTPPLQPLGTPFRRAVWEILREIPYGRTVTYKQVTEELMRRTGSIRMSARAVGSAIGHNPISIIIPCHRVIGSNGRLTGYAGGLDRKRRLLEIEHCMP